MLPLHSLVLQHPRLRRLECGPRRQVLLKRVPFHQDTMGRSSRHLQRRLCRSPSCGFRGRAYLNLPRSKGYSRRAGHWSVVLELWQSDNGTVMEPFSKLWIIGPVRDTHHRWIRGWWKANSKKEMQDKARDMYRDHYELVRRITPPDRLLEYKLGDGWEPLCAFLGKKVPEVDFPRVNDQKHMQEFLGLVARRSMKNGLWNVGRVLLPIVVVMCASWWVWSTKWG